MVILKSLKFNADFEVLVLKNVEQKPVPYNLSLFEFRKISYHFSPYCIVEYHGGYTKRCFKINMNDELNQKNANYLFHFQYLMKLERGKSY